MSAGPRIPALITAMALLAVAFTGRAQPSDEPAPAAPEAPAADAAPLNAQRQQLDEQQRELEQARRELARARREMEAAARQISRLSSGAPHRAVFVGTAAHPGLHGTARIGVNIQNAETGALVLGVTPGGPADRAGVLSGDVITSVADTPTIEAGREPAEVVIATLAGITPGTVVPVSVTRAGEPLQMDVTTEDVVPAMRVLRDLPVVGDFVLPDLSDLPEAANLTRGMRRFVDLSELFASRWYDMELVTLTADLGRYFDTDEGLLVVRAPDGDDLDLRDGDVILGISGRQPQSPEHAMQILASFVPGESLQLDIMRRQRRQTIDYTIPDPAAGDR